jgi:polar amino acid transport system permease protein
MADVNQRMETAATPPQAPDEAFDFEVQQYHKWYRRPDVVVPVVLIVLGLTMLATVGGTTRRYRSQFTPDADVSFSWDYFFHLVPQMLQGLYITARATVLGFLIAASLGLVLALLRRSNNRFVSFPTAFVIEFIRSTPILVQIFFAQVLVRASDAISLPPIVILFIVLGIHYATYASEAYRAGINSVPQGQWEASIALNLNPVTNWTRIIIPQAVPNVLPTLGNYLVAAFKDAPIGDAVLSTAGVLFFAQTIVITDFRPIEPFLLIGVGFLLVSLPSAWLVRRLEARIEYERD